MTENGGVSDGTVQSISPATPRIKLVLYDTKAVRVFEPADFEEVNSLEKKYGGEIWVDIVTSDIDSILTRMNVCREPNDNYIRDEEERTVFQLPVLVRFSSEVQYLYIICTGPNKMMTIRKTAWSKGPIESTLQFVGDLVEDETDDGKMPLPNFRDFVFTAILGACSDEFIATINETRKKVNRIYETIIHSTNPMDAQGKIYEIHSFLSESFGTTVFLFREFVSLVRKGSGKHLKLTLYANYIEKIMNDVTQAIEMEEGLENSLELLSNTVRATLSDRNIANTERLNRAVEILTRLSVLLMIPNSVFTLWPTLPFATGYYMGLHSGWWELIIALLFTAAGQVIISYYYNHSYLKGIFGTNDSDKKT